MHIPDRARSQAGNADRPSEEGRRRGEGELVTAKAAGQPLTVEDLTRRFTELTRLVYDTRVPFGVLEREVVPHIAPGARFVDPAAHAQGFRLLQTGLSGVHCMLRFDLDIDQLAVQMNDRGDGGRVLVDGVMNLRLLPVYTYPLRTILRYDFVLTDGGRGFSITLLEEMWSLGDLFYNLPFVGRLYDVGRRGVAYLVGGQLWVAHRIATRLNPSCLE